MKVYAHRANQNGSNINLENTKIATWNCFNKGYNVELDIRLKDGKLYLGHDEPKDEIVREFLEDSRILAHAKTWQTFEYLLRYKQIHSFFQSLDDVSITSQGYRIWHQNSGKCRDFGNKDIVVDLDWSTTCEAYGIITNYPNLEYDNEKIGEAFKLLILDVDGVLTNGRKTYDSEHNVLSKEFCDRDFTAIKRFKSAGIPVLLLSGDNFNSGMALSRSLPFFNARNYSKQLDKAIAIEKIAEEYKFKLEDIAYVGDDYYDLSALNVVGHPYCPQNASSIVKQNATILNRNGGDGVIDALYEQVKDKIIQRYPYES